MWHSKSVNVAVILLAVFLLFYTISIIKDLSKPSMPINVVTVEGMGEAFAKPDVANFSVTSSKDAMLVADAQKVVNDKINATMDVLKKAGIEDKDIKTTDYSVSPKYEWVYERCGEAGSYNCGGKNVLKGYTVSQTLSIKVRKTDTAGDIITKVGEIGLTNISGLSFVVDSPDSVKAEARNEAIQNAQDKAEVLAKKLGVKLVRVTGFYENNPVYYGGDMYDREMTMSAKAMAPSAPATLPVGENKYSSNVSVTYEIR